MDDIELLRFAAKALGLPLSSEWNCAAEGFGIIVGHGNGDHRACNPLVDNGEALKVACRLHLSIISSWGI